MKRARSTLKKWFDKHYPPIKPLTTAALATGALFVAGCGSSQTTSTIKPAQPSQQQIQQQRNIQRDAHILAVVTDWSSVTAAMQPIVNHLATAQSSEWDNLVAAVAKLKISLGQLRQYMNADQQAQLDGYLPVLTDLQDGARAGSVGDYMTGIEKWTGVAPQIRELGKLIVSLENESGGNA